MNYTDNGGETPHVWFLENKYHLQFGKLNKTKCIKRGHHCDTKCACGTARVSVCVGTCLRARTRKIRTEAQSASQYTRPLGAPIMQYTTTR
mmetsp:Transcript_75666/g.122860  ORF Transcript_75666/g.122860 Transcript_75666/m.122860 type:complete len:91 (+) Transcript_75666:73-345(+)